MYKLMSVALVALTTMVTIASAAPEADAGGHAGWMTDFEAARKLAAEKSLPILADFSGSDWCGWCIKLDKEVFSKKPFREYARQNVVLFLADFPSRTKQPAELKAQNEKLAQTYGVRGFPTVLLLDAKGKELARTGYKPGGPKAYIEHIKELLVNSRKADPAS